MSGFSGPQFQVGFHPLFVSTRTAEVGARRNAHGALGVLFNSEAGGDFCGYSPGVDDQLGADGHILGVCATASARADAAHPVGRILDHLGDGQFFFEASSRTLCTLDQRVVKVHARARHSVSGKRGLIGPLHVDCVAASNDCQTAVSRPTRSINTHEDELLNGSGSQAITADFVARETRLVDKEDINSKGRQMVSGRCTAGAGADYDDVGTHVLGLLAHHSS